MRADEIRDGPGPMRLIEDPIYPEPKITGELAGYVHGLFQSWLVAEGQIGPALRELESSALSGQSEIRSFDRSLDRSLGDTAATDLSREGRLADLASSAGPSVSAIAKAVDGGASNFGAPIEVPVAEDPTGRIRADFEPFHRQLPRHSVIPDLDGIDRKSVV